MVPKPLRWDVSFLIAVWLALPAAAVDVVVPTDLGPSPAGGVGASGGAALSGSNASLVPSLSAGLAAPSAAPLAAPLAAPSALVAPAAAAAAAPTLAPAPSVAAPAAALKAPAPHAPAAASGAFQKNIPGTEGYDPNKTSYIPASMMAEMLDAAGVKHGWGAAGDAKQGQIFDGAKPAGAWVDDYLDKPVPPAKPPVPALKPLSKAAAMSGPESKSSSYVAPAAAPVVEAPAPPKSGALAAAGQKVSAALSGLWSSVKQGLGATPPPVLDLAPRIEAMVLRRMRVGDDPLETPAGILVHAPRALRYDALGFRVHFAPPDGYRGGSVLDQPERVRVERGESDEGTEALRRRFASFNALIEANFAALELMAQSSSKMTVKNARAVLEKAEEMARRYSELVGARRGTDFTVELAGLGIGFDKAVAGLSDADLLPAEATALVMPLDRESVHFYINKLHQEALRAVGQTDVASPANLKVMLGEGASAREASLVDLSEHPLVKDGRIVSPAFKALVEAMRRSKDQPKGSLMLQDHQFWGHFQLGAHSAEVYANFLPPDEGGMIRVRYQEWGTGYDNQTRLYYVASMLQKTGFHVQQDNGFLTAVVDKDHASQTVDEMTDTFALVIQALHATVGVDFALPLLVQGAKSSEEVGGRIDQWVDTVLAEGTLPFYVHNDHDEMVKGWAAYGAGAAKRENLRAALNRTLSRLGLPEIPREELVGQRTIDRFVNAPIEAALARGELRLTAKGVLEKTPDYSPLRDLALSLEVDRRAAGRMAEAVSSLDPGLFRFETVGSLGALTVERAQRRLDPGGWITVTALRDPKTGQIGLAQAEISELKPGQSPRRLDPATLFARLAEQGYPVAAFVPSENPPGLDFFGRLLQSEPGPDRSIGRRVQGLAASPGHARTVFARVTYDKEKAAQGGSVFVAPYTTPDDLDAIRASKAVITTSGGLLSHAAITTREMGIPAVILPRAEWRGGAAALESPRFGEPFRAAGLAARAAHAAEGVVLSEGALVRLDPVLGSVEVFTPAVSEALLDATAALERYDRGDGAGVLTSWLSDRMGSPSMTSLQKAALMHEALDGMIARALARPDAAADLARLYRELPKGNHALASWGAVTSSELFDAARREADDYLKEKSTAVESALSIEAAERALRQAEARATRLSEIASALERPRDEIEPIREAIAGARAGAKARVAKLLAEDVAELQEHARLFPTATAEVLPRLKAAIAKAKRRSVSAKVVASWEARVKALESERESAMRGLAPVVLPLRQVLDLDVPRVGGKAAKLGEISEVVARAGGTVPPGLALTVDAYRTFLRETGIASRLDRIAADPELSPEERAARARKLILGAPLSADRGVGAAIVASLKAEGLEHAMLAVRSSAVDEDGADAAFAGAGDTHLYVSADEVLPHVKDIWASLWNPRALLYRQTKGLSTANLAQAVVIQEMADSEISGVAFTQDPVSGDSSRLIVNAAFGLGEGVVSGRVGPDQYVVGKSLGREILPPMIADKKLAVIRGRDGRGTEERKMPAEWRRRRSMTPRQLEKLNAVALALENHFGYALDIEFGFSEGKLYILQARPVTNGATEEPAPPALASAKPASAPEPKRVMFVCAGNTCRSPMAERMAKTKLKVEGRDDVEVLSRGLAVAEMGEPMSAGARQALDRYKVSGDGHLAMPVENSDVIWADAILTMTAAQADELKRRHPQARGKVFTLGEYSGAGGDVADPYGGDAEAYQRSALQIATYVDSALDRLEAAPAASVPAR